MTARRFNPYPAYKDSGVEWLGEIPAHWEVRRLTQLIAEPITDGFMLHLAQVVRNGLGDRAGTCIDPKTQVVQGKTVCVVSCQRSPEPVFLKGREMEGAPDGDFFVRSGPGTVKLSPDSAQKYVRTRFGDLEAVKRASSR